MPQICKNLTDCFRPEVPSVAGVVQRRAPTDRSTTDPRWRHSNPDSHYGFRTTSFLQSCQYQQHLYPQQQQLQQPPQVQWRYDGLDGHYALPDQLPRYLWGPPPPYSQPPSLENIREAASVTSSSNLASAVVTSGPTSPTSTLGNAESRQRNLDQLQDQQQQLPTLARTTKSGLLVYSSSDFSLNNNNSNSSNNFVHSAMTMSAYDESVKSAVHVYEQANELRRKRNKKRDDNNLNYCNSLPTRKLKKKSERGALTTLAGFKSTANLPDAILSSFDTPNNFSILGNNAISIPGNSMSPNRILGLQATSKQQSLPLPPIPAPKPKRASEIYRPASVVSRSSCSTTENKYETIGKSLSPYKIAETSPTSRQVFPNAKISSASVSKKLRSSLDSSSFSSSGSPSGDSDQGYGFGSGSSPMSLATSPAGDGSPSKSPSKVISSHYAQISPLRGEGLPPPGRMGLTPATAANPPSPVKSYFQVS